MKIPVKRLKGYLHKIMYKDVATVKRSVEYEDEYTGESKCGFKAVIENLPCRLCQYKDIDADKNDRAQGIEWDFRLNCDPEVVIEEGDVVDVIHGGETFRLLAGTSFNYDTHKEISLRRRKEAVQR